MQRFSVLLILPLLLAVAARAAEGDVQLKSAREHYQHGRYDEALEAYDLAKEKADPASVAIGQSLVYEGQGNLETAAKTLEAATKSAEKHAKLWARLAEVELSRGRYAESAKAVGKALAIDAELPIARLVQADLNTATGKLKEADEQYRWFVRYYNKAQPEDAETLLVVARGAAQFARWNRSPKIFDFIINTLCPDALKDDKESWQTYALSGKLLLEKYNRAEAMPEFRKALSINSRAAEVHAALALDSLDEHDLDEAAQHSKRALEINPHQLTALHVKADLRLEDSQPAEAVKVLETALPVNPHDEGTLGRLAAAYLLIDGPPPADELKQLFANLETISKVQVAKPGRFTTLLISLAKQNPHPGRFFSIAGANLERKRQFDLAETFYKQAIASMPQLSEPKTMLGMLQMRVGRNDEARKILDDAFKHDPYHVRVSNMIKVLKVLETYDAVTTEHFIIRVDSKQDRILGRYMAEYLEEEYPGLVKQFGFEPPTKTQFEIYNKSKGLSGHQWFSARMVGLPWIQTVGASTGKIVALASPTESENPFNWARVLKHEFVHILTLQQTKFNIPHWYTEALAVMNEGFPRPPQWDDLLLERVPKGELMNLDNLNQGFIRPKTPNDWQMAYCQSLLYAQYMKEKFGPETIPGMLEAYRNNLTTDDAIQRVTGVDKATFEKGYKEYLNKIVADLQGGTAEASQSLAELEKAHLKNPKDANATGKYALAMLKANKRKEARQLALDAREQDVKNPQAALVLASLALRAEDLDEAVSILKSALDKEKPNLAIVTLLGQLRLKQDAPAEAMEYYELGLKQRPRSLELLKGLAVSSLKAGKKSELRVTLRKLADLDADDVSVRKKLTDLALEEKAYDEAVRYARDALHIDVLDPELHTSLAKSYAGVGQAGKAVEEWQTAVELKPAEADYQLALAQAQVTNGKKVDAVKTLDELLKKQPKHAAAKKLAEELKAK